MSSGVILPILLGLAAAAAWGAADFTGALASRRASIYGVVVGGELVGLMLLSGAVLIAGEPAPARRDWLLAALAGMGGGFGLVLLYRALTAGQMSLAAPVSAVLAAFIPVLLGAFIEGLPGLLTIGGLILAILAVWLIARSEAPDASIKTWLKVDQIRLPLISGIVFGFFFVLLHQASQEAIIWPIIATRIASITFLLSFAFITRQPLRVPRQLWLLVLLAGLLDTSGNVFFVLSGRAGRMDVASVLSSLYPAGTVALAWLILKERLQRSQWFGVAAAFVAIFLLAL
jgi:drug/metabolite transporter (DMT)-like permease